MTNAISEGGESPKTHLPSFALVKSYKNIEKRRNRRKDY